MAGEETESNGRATVALVDAKVDGLKELIRAEFKDVGRRLDDLSGLEPRVRQLETDAIRRVGPVMDEIHKFEKHVDELTTKVDKIASKSVSAEQVKTALAFDRDQRTRSTDARFTKREKAFASVIALALLALNAYQAFHPF